MRSDGEREPALFVADEVVEGEAVLRGLLLSMLLFEKA